MAILGGKSFTYCVYSYCQTLLLIENDDNLSHLLVFQHIRAPPKFALPEQQFINEIFFKPARWISIRGQKLMKIISVVN